jgi:2-oxoacid:acceptor oxidoreductase gamma subunit (pyruvate/2-ketoisovalerate family)
MFEVRFHGRGGQGVVLAARLLASAFFKDGKYVQAFPSFGAERRGAPVVAFARASDDPIRARFGIYKPDCVIVLDSTLTKGPAVTQGLKNDHWIIINTDKTAGEYAGLGAYRVATVNASAIARKYQLGTQAMPLVNTIILGAFPKVTRMVSIGAVVDAIRENLPSKPQENARAAMEAYESLNLENYLSFC